jgi:hypothetical protein
MSVLGHATLTPQRDVEVPDMTNEHPSVDVRRERLMMRAFQNPLVGRPGAAEARQSTGHHRGRNGVLVLPPHPDRRRARRVHPSGGGSAVGTHADRPAVLASPRRDDRSGCVGGRGAAATRQGGALFEHRPRITVPGPREVDLHRWPDGAFQQGASTTCGPGWTTFWRRVFPAPRKNADRMSSSPRSMPTRTH